MLCSNGYMETQDKTVLAAYTAEYFRTEFLNSQVDIALLASGRTGIYRSSSFGRQLHTDNVHYILVGVGYLRS